MNKLSIYRNYSTTILLSPAYSIDLFASASLISVAVSIHLFGIPFMPINLSSYNGWFGLAGISLVTADLFGFPGLLLSLSSLLYVLLFFLFNYWCYITFIRVWCYRIKSLFVDGILESIVSSWSPIVAIKT